MKKLSLLIVSFLFVVVANSQTKGTLTFTVTTAATGGYSPKHLLAIWIEKADGTFIKTKLKKGNNYTQYLNVWKAKSNNSVTDATTGATISSHQTPETITWNGTDVNGNLVPDGDYKLWIQMAYNNVNGPTYSISFTKGTSSANPTIPDQTSFKTMSLSWVPDFTGINDEVASDFSFNVTPNPISGDAKILFTLREKTNVVAEMFDLSGKKVKVIFNGSMNTGENTLSLNTVDSNSVRIPNGIYLITLTINGKKYSQKVLINR